MARCSVASFEILLTWCMMSSCGLWPSSASTHKSRPQPVQTPTSEHAETNHKKRTKKNKKNKKQKKQHVTLLLTHNKGWEFNRPAELALNTQKYKREKKGKSVNTNNICSPKVFILTSNMQSKRCSSLGS